MFKKNSEVDVIFVLLNVLMSFFLSFDYSIVRSASNSLFISFYGSEALPLVWLMTVPVNFAVIWLYNKYLPKFGNLKTFSTTIFIIILVNVSSTFFITKYPIIAFTLFIWKDIYILMMFKQMWSLIHTTVNTSKAKFLYGTLFGVGGIGSVVGSFIPHYLATKIGSGNLFLFSFPTYLIIGFCYFHICKRTNKQKISINVSNSSAKEGLSLILRSKFLFFILLTVVCMQISVALIEYQFNVFLEHHISNVDLRTAFMGKILGVINLSSTVMQFVVGGIIFKFFSLKKIHFTIPLLLTLNAFILIVYPIFFMAAYAFIFIKMADFSIFGVAREMLYIPLKTDEKFRAKAIIDVFAYRTAKALASFLLMFIQVFIINANLVIGILSVIIFSMCCYVALKLGNYYEQSLVKA